MRDNPGDFTSETAKAASAKGVEARQKQKADDVRMGITGKLDDAEDTVIISKLQRLSNSKDERIALQATSKLADLRLRRQSGDDGPAAIVFYSAWISPEESTWPPSETGD